MADNKMNYPASAAITITLASLASSSGKTAGRAGASVTNGTNLYLNYELSGKITDGTTPTANTFIEEWYIPKGVDGTWPDTFGGTDAAVTVTSREMLASYGTLLRAIPVPATTSNVACYFDVSLLDKVSVVAKEWQLFVVHNTGVNLNSTGGNHVINQAGQYTTTT